MALVFDPEKHTYRRDGHKLLSVTEVLRHANLVNTSWYDEQCAWRGSVVHDCIRLYHENDLNERSVDPQAEGYLDGYKRFLRSRGCKPIFWEMPLDSAIHNFAGRFDVIVRADEVDVLVDVKTGAVEKATGLQLAAYELLIRENGLADPRRRYAVRLTKDGKYSLTEFTDYRDQDRFLEALNVLKLQQVFGTFKEDNS